MGDMTQTNHRQALPSDIVPSPHATRLAEATSERITNILVIRGAEIDDTLRQAIWRKSRELADIALRQTKTTDHDTISAIADACASILCDLPAANIMEILLPDPHLAPFEQDIRAIAQASTATGVGPYGGEDPELRQTIQRYANDATTHWDAMSPHGKVLAKMDKTAVRKGLMVGLGFDGYLRAEREMEGIFAPRKPYSLGAYGKGHEEEDQGFRQATPSTLPSGDTLSATSSPTDTASHVSQSTT